MDTWKKSVLSAKKPVSVKFLLFRGGFGGGGGGSADFIFMGARIFLIFGADLIVSRCPSTVSRTVLKRKRVNFQRIFLVSPTEKERKHAFVRVQIEYGFGCFQVRFGLVVSTVWIGSEYGFVTLVDESASESHTQNSTRTAP